MEDGARRRTRDVRKLLVDLRGAHGLTRQPVRSIGICVGWPAWSASSLS